MSNNPPLSAEGAESGVVVEFVPSTAIPSISGGIRTVALIGTGKTTKTLTGSVTRGASAIDALLPPAFSLPNTITDANYVNYAIGVDYELSVAAILSATDISAGAAVSGLTLDVSINGASPLVTTFSGSNPISASSIASQLNTTLGSAAVAAVVVLGSANYISLTATNPTVAGNSINVTGGSANAFLGFVENGIVDNLGVAGFVDWGDLVSPAQFTSNLDATSGLNVSGLTFSVSVNGNTPLVTTFTGSNPVAASSIVSQLNTVLGSQASAATVGSGPTYISLTNSNTPGPINTIQILGGTANSVLGFTGGLIAEGATQPNEGTVYSFSYQSPKVSADYVPTVYYDLQDLINDMGPIPVNTATAPAVYNLQPTDFTLPLGAQVIFQNSANSGAIVAMQLDPADQPALTGFQTALNKLLAVPNINIVCALTGDPNLYPAILAHVTNASAPLEGNFRTAIVGMQGNPSIATATGYAAGFAAGGNGRRILLAYPPAAAVPGTNGDIMTDGSFIAAAIAGLRINSNYDVAEPLLRKALGGIDSIPANLLRSQKLALRNGGVTVVETVNGVIRVMEDTTTDRSTVDAQNYSVTEIIDFVSESTQSTLNNLFIGIKLLTDTPSMIVTTLNLLLSTFVDLQIINSFQNVQASVNNIDPTQIDVSFEVAPVYPLRYISVTFSI